MLGVFRGYIYRGSRNGCRIRTLPMYAISRKLPLLGTIILWRRAEKSLLIVSLYV